MAVQLASHVHTVDCVHCVQCTHGTAQGCLDPRAVVGWNMGKSSGDGFREVFQILLLMIMIFKPSSG